MRMFITRSKELLLHDSRANRDFIDESINSWPLKSIATKPNKERCSHDPSKGAENDGSIGDKLITTEMSKGLRDQNNGIT